MIFVTGGSGLVGSFLIPALVARGLKVRALYRKQIPAIAPAEAVEWVEGDLRDTLLLKSALEGVTHVFHCAGLVSYAPQDEEALLQVNVEGTAAVVDACLEQPGVRLCYVSSVAALGGGSKTQGAGTAPNAPEVLDEQSKWELGAAHGAYATSKYLAELEVWRGVSEGLWAVMVNPSVILGPADWLRSSTRLFRYAWQEHYFYTPGSINVVDVRDVIELMMRLTLNQNTAGERYILNGATLPLQEFLSQAATCFGKKPPTIEVPEWAAETIWRLEHARSLMTGARPLITKDTARAGRHPIVYKASKVQQATGHQFRPLPETIAWCCRELKMAERASHKTS
ncbi:NAD-dependent epimerase/dehydratase family protein [Hymenobacter sp. BT186]|uniref:NAD-dependent epimerase/dehydratase family protein n=1 Tax=Hymenobacter telluris TaxID=2816474 RepID=A0A939ETN5_9BACT|nr:NAD-dependent epimerase/dehydratase family protein [Hymenobacter telluris]MBO0357076.1 NAD-dependent epimerase/dehydratase family protein [Hymenobacter telluris]MBW3373103.1 NAD-dependent epimerase/dehydratase family protein [Hymenobacter norwichensis]